MSDFKNTLRVGDQVFDVELARRGVVSVTSEKKRFTKVIFDGLTNAKSRDVLGLRFIIPGGKAEDDAPFTGELPPLDSPAPVPRQPSYPAVQLVAVTPLESLEAKLAANNTRRDVIQKEYVALGHENGRIENAIAALKAI